MITKLFNRESLSIKAKVWLIVVSLGLSIVAYGLFEQYSLNKLDQLENAAFENLQSKVDLLTLRRHEKDFLARRDPKYLQRFDKTIDELKARLVTLSGLLNHNTQETSYRTSLDKVSSTLVDYQQKFKSLGDQTAIIGLSDNEGLLSQLKQVKSQLAQSFVAGADQNSSDLMHLYHIGADYLISPSAELQELFKQHSSSSNINSAASVLYIETMKKLMQAQEKLGLSEKEGLKGSLRSSVHQTEEAMLNLQNQIEQIVRSEAIVAKNQLHLLGVALALIISAMLVVIGRSITSRLSSLNELMRDIANGDGDLTVRMNATGDDELAQLAHSFDTFVDKLHQNIKQLANVMNVLTDNSCSSESAARQSQKNAEQQKIESESVATAVNELVMTSAEITSNIENAAQNARQISDEAENSFKLTNTASSGIESLANKVQQSQQHVSKLEAQSKDIQAVITTIRGISEQTNLLALNAAIEAARAGEHGRGFAVVADEVRQLSLMTNDSTQQIENTIDTLVIGINESVKLMEESLSSATTTKDQTNAVNNAISYIVKQVSDMSDLNAQIATASEEQSMVSNDIDRTITQIAELASDTHAAVSTSATCSEQVADVSEQLKHIVGQFKY